jgi:ADP-heptose:LPS heptosyltransferase
MSKAAPLQAVLGNDYFFDHTLTYPVGTRNPVLLAKLGAAIRSLNIDTVINITALRSMSADRRDKLFFKVAGVKSFYGFDQTPEDFQISIDAETGFYEWEAKRLARKIEALGKFSLGEPKYWDLKFTDAETNSASTAMKGLANGERIMVLNAGTKMPVKDWGRSNWIQLIQMLGQKFQDHSLLILGVDEESTLASELLQHWKGDGRNLCGKTSPRVSAAIMRHAFIFIGHDSGPMHLAACVGTPCVAIFSLINRPRQWFPRGSRNVILFPEGPRDSYEPEHPTDPVAKSILTIKPERVFQAVVEVLIKSSPS